MGRVEDVEHIQGRSYDAASLALVEVGGKADLLSSTFSELRGSDEFLAYPSQPAASLTLPTPTPTLTPGPNGPKAFTAIPNWFVRCPRESVGRKVLVEVPC